MMAGILERVKTAFGRVSRKPAKKKMVPVPPPPPEPTGKELFAQVVREYSREDCRYSDEEYDAMEQRVADALPVEEYALADTHECVRNRHRDSRYPRLDLSFLSWTERRRGEDRVIRNWPKFGVFFRGRTVMHLGRYGHLNTYSAEHESDTIPEEVTRVIEPHYAPLLRDFSNTTREEKWDEYLKYSLSATLSALVPKEVRDIQKSAQEYFPHIGLIAEVKNWEVRQLPMPPREPEFDPLLVGFADGTAWLLASFDLTETEDYVVGTHTS